DEKLTDQGVQFGGAVLPVDRETLSDTDETSVTLGVRPEDLELVPDEQGIAVEVDLVEERGADAYVHGRRAGTDAVTKPFIARVAGRRPAAKGESVYFRPRVGYVRFFDIEAGQRLGS